MGAAVSSAFASVGDRCTACQDAVGLLGMTALYAAVYFVFFLACIAGVAVPIIMDSVAPDATMGFIFVTPCNVIHFIIVLTAMSLVKGYVIYPIKPKWAYAIADILLGVMLGLAFGATFVGGGSYAAVGSACGVSALAYAIILSKYWRIFWDVRAGIRDGRTGALLDGEQYAEAAYEEGGVEDEFSYD